MKQQALTIRTDMQGHTESPLWQEEKNQFDEEPLPISSTELRRIDTTKATTIYNSAELDLHNKQQL